MEEPTIELYPTENDQLGVEEKSTYFCYICYEEKTNSKPPEDMSQFALSCGHAFCRGCIFDYFHSSICDGVINPKCFHPKNVLEVETPSYQGIDLADGRCGFTVTESDMLAVIQHDSSLKDKYARFKFMQENVHGRECPYPECGTLQIGDPLLPNMTCKSCQRSFCFLHANAHLDKSCEDYIQSISQDQKLNMNFIAETTKPCPNCSKPITKSGGCNHMKCVCGAAFCWLCGKEIDDAVFPRHFQWWNANGCANMQMNNEIEPHWSTRVFARGLAIAQIVILGPLSALSTFLSILLCPCCLSAVAAPQETLFLRFFELLANCMSGWGMFYTFLLFVLPPAILGSVVALAIVIISYPAYAIFRLYHKQYPWPDVITHVANRCCSRLSRMTFRRQPPPAAHFDFHSHRMVTDASSNYSNSSNLLELRVPPPNFSNTGDPAEQLQDLERYFRELREAREASFCSNKSRTTDKGGSGDEADSATPEDSFGIDISDLQIQPELLVGVPLVLGDRLQLPSISLVAQYVQPGADQAGKVAAGAGSWSGSTVPQGDKSSAVGGPGSVGSTGPPGDKSSAVGVVSTVTPGDKGSGMGGPGSAVSTILPGAIDMNESEAISERVGTSDGMSSELDDANGSRSNFANPFESANKKMALEQLAPEFAVVAAAACASSTAAPRGVLGPGAGQVELGGGARDTDLTSDDDESCDSDLLAAAERAAAATAVAEKEEEAAVAAEEASRNPTAKIESLQKRMVVKGAFVAVSDDAGLSAEIANDSCVIDIGMV